MTLPLGLVLVTLALLLGPVFVRSRRPERAQTLLLLIVAVVAATHYFYLSRAPNHLHRWDLFHTMMGAKYFDELGYTRLYECALYFDRETHGHYANVRRMRDLATRRIVDVDAALSDSECDRRFTPARRQQFVEDLAVFNSLIPPQRWKKLFRDKGYNGPPFYTFVASRVASRVPFGADTFFALSLVDVALVLGAFAVAARAFGAKAALVAFVFFCVSFPNRFEHMGGSFLRFDYVAYLIAAFSWLHLGRAKSAAVFFALASMTRLFPVLFAAGVFVHAAIEIARTRAVRKDHVAFASIFAVTLLAAFLLSASFAHGLGNWSGQLENMRVHTSQSSGYRIGIRHLFAWHGEITKSDPFVPYRVKAREVKERRPAWLLAVALFVTPLLMVMTRLERARAAILFGTLLLFLLFDTTRYYYSVLVLVCLAAFAGAPSWPWTLSTVLLFLISGIAWAVDAVNDFAPFLYNTLFSFLLLVFFASLLAALVATLRPWASEERARRIRGGRRLFVAPGAAEGLALPIAGIAIGGMTLWGLSAFGTEEDERFRTAAPPAIACCDESTLLGPEDLPVVAKVVDHLWRGGSAATLTDLPERFATPAQAVYVALRSSGRRRAEGWETSGTTLEALESLLGSLRREIGAQKAEAIDRIEIDLTHSYEDLRADDPRLFSNVRRGVNGVEISHDGRVRRFAPTRIIATNRSHARLGELVAEELGLSRERLRAEARFRLFEAEQLLVQIGPPAEARLLYRGNEIVPVDTVTADGTRRTADLAARWLIDNVHENGRLTYKYWPSNGRESDANNMIRQWMATVALVRVAAEREDPALWRLIERNIDYNLASFYREEDELGLIEWEDEVKLGAVALAALALVEHPRAEKWRRQEMALRRTVEALWNPDGSFRTFYRPAERSGENQNFYPGEALLLWATVYAKERDEGLLDRFLKSFEYYREWHLDERRRNPAFVPWHTQADYAVWKLTRNEALRDFIFEMNDWLLAVQEWDDSPRFPDTNGRFYDPNRPFGPPHASSTGVYLEGLIDAFALARELGDEERREAYRLAIVRGLRSVMQLQFADEVDLFYVSTQKTRRVLGGIRTTVYDNEIRCDNVQHNLMAMLKILRTFDDEDYRHDPPRSRRELDADDLEFRLHRNPGFRLDH